MSAIGLASAVVTFLALWFATGEVLVSIPAYFHGSLEIALGYGAATSGNDPAVNWAYTLGLIMLFAGFWAGWDSTRGALPRQRIGLLSCEGVHWLFAFKEGIVREDPGHVVSFFDALLVGWCGFRWATDGRLRMFAGALTLGIASLALQSVSLTQDFDPSRGVSDVVNNMNIAFSPAKHRHYSEAGRALIRQTDVIDRRSLALLRGHTVAAFPSEISPLWAYRLDWKLFAVFQSYAAYTPYLDDLDARFLDDSRRAPQRILEGAAQTIDDRAVPYDEPATTRNLLCRYRQLRAGADFDVLAGAPDRCGAPHLIATVRAGWGRNIPVPAPSPGGAMVFVRISGAEVRGWESIQSLSGNPECASSTSTASSSALSRRSRATAW